MTRYLAIHVRAHEGRWHGEGEDPPSPFRLFQAFVAGAGISGPLDERTVAALGWLEALPDAPVIAAPRIVHGQSVAIFVPNNDLDAFGGDPRRIGKVRTATKVTRARFFDDTQPWIYVWPFHDVDEDCARAVCALAERLYQFGRGVDMAWAWGELFDDARIDALLAGYEGLVLRPSAGSGVRCPHTGSLDSLVRRHQARRFRVEGGRRVFVRRSEPSYREVAYQNPSAQYVFGLRSTADSALDIAWPLDGASPLVLAARDAAREKLCGAMPARALEIDRYLVGRSLAGMESVPAKARVQIVPIPSIGTHHADRGIRRLLVEVPAACPLRSEDVRWAFTGARLLELTDACTGEMKGAQLVPVQGDEMLRHYGCGSDAGARVFRSVTPVALPDVVNRRRVIPGRQRDEAKGSRERVSQASRAAGAVVQALRQAGVSVRTEFIRVQREPFDAKGVRAELFAEGTRFAKERLWHVEIELDRNVEGPLVIGDGRFVGLGVMAPGAPAASGLHAFGVAGGHVANELPVVLARALRRAVMARVRDVLGLAPDDGLDRFFSGHERDGSKAAAHAARHLAYHWDPPRERLLLLAPHRLERRAAHRDERQHLRTLERALGGFTQLRAGAAGCMTVRRLALSDGDPLLASARRWSSITPYFVTRHRRCASAQEALTADVVAECERCGLPRPEVSVLDIRAVSGQGLHGLVRLDFSVAVAGPIALGRSARLGGGLFSANDRPDNPPHGTEDGLEDRDPLLAPAVTGSAAGAATSARSRSDLAEHGFRARTGGPGVAEGPARGATQPADATRHFDTAEGRLNYSELARRLAEPLLRIDDRIRCGEFAERAMDADLLLTFHAALCAGLFPEHAGRYRTMAVQVGAHEAPPPHEVAARILEYTRNLEARLQHLPGEPDGRWLEALAYAEGELLSIHPFPDLNGRVSRLWLLELLRRMGLPPVDIVPSDADFRKRYLNALAAADERDWQPLQALWEERMERAGEQP